jgi:N-acetylneuraminic acid mutarotase
MIIFGGHISSDNNDYIGDAAAYDPISDSWRLLPDSGLSERMGAAAIWTGEGFLVWGGVNTSGWLADGAIYSPETDSWRPMAGSPLDPRQGASVRLDGDWVLFEGGIHNAESFAVPAARYHVRTDAWAAIDASEPTGSWPLGPGDNVGLTGLGTTFEVDGQVVAIPPLPAGLSGAAATYTGSALVILGGEAAQDTPGDFAFMIDLRK